MAAGAYTPGVAGTPNYTGTAIFLSYIIAALTLTYSIVIRLLRRADAATGNARIGSRVVLAVISFTVLSYHMSAFLVTSYSTWAADDVWRLDVWHWMLKSSLFTDFAHELISNDWAVVWTTAALIWTGAVNIWLAVEGRRHKTKNLWQYFALGQILPISFAQTLFAIDLSISRASEQPSPEGNEHPPQDPEPAPAQSKSGKPTEDQGDEDGDAHDDEHIDTELGPSLLDGPDAAVITFTSIATMYMIYLLPSYAGKPEFMYMVLTVRLLLFAPYIVAMRQEEPEEGGMDPMDATFYIAVLIIPIALLLRNTLEQIPPGQTNLQAAVDGLHTGMATRALGYDFLLGFGIFILLLLGA